MSAENDEDASIQGGIDESVKKQLADFNKAITALEELVDENQATFDDHLKRDAFSMLKMDTATIFTANALATAYLSTFGHNPKNIEGIQAEMERVKTVMKRTKDQEERRKLAPEVHQRAAKAFVRNALFDLEESKQRIQEKKATERSMASKESEDN